MAPTRAICANSENNEYSKTAPTKEGHCARSGFTFRMVKCPNDKSTKIVLTRRMIVKHRETRDQNGNLINKHVETIYTCPSKATALASVADVALAAIAASAAAVDGSTDSNNNNKAVLPSINENPKKPPRKKMNKEFLKKVQFFEPVSMIEPEPEDEDEEEGEELELTMVQGTETIEWPSDDENGDKKMIDDFLVMAENDEVDEEEEEKAPKVTAVLAPFKEDVTCIDELEKEVQEEFKHSVLDKSIDSETGETNSEEETHEEWNYSYYSCDKKEFQNFLFECCYRNRQYQFEGKPWSYFCKQIYPKETEDLNSIEIRLFESLFEIITSELSYIKDLATLKSFSTKENLVGSLSRYKRTILFGTLTEIYELNRKMFKEFVVSFSVSVYMEAIVLILFTYLCDDEQTETETETSDLAVDDEDEKAEQLEVEVGGEELGSLAQSKLAPPYIAYLRMHNERMEIVREMQQTFQSPQKIDFYSLNKLMLAPVQRITRYPILLTNVLDSLKAIRNQSGFDQSTYWMNVDTAISNVEITMECAKSVANQCNQWIEADAEQNQLNIRILLRKIYWNPKTLGYDLKDSGCRRIIEQIPIIWSYTPIEFLKAIQMKRRSLLVLFNDLLLVIQVNFDNFQAVQAASWHLVDYEKGSSYEQQQSQVPDVTPNATLTITSPDGMTEESYEISFISDKKRKLFSYYYRRFCAPNKLAPRL